VVFPCHDEIVTAEFMVSASRPNPISPGRHVPNVTLVCDDFLWFLASRLDRDGQVQPRKKPAPVQVQY